MSWRRWRAAPSQTQWQFGVCEAFEDRAWSDDVEVRGCRGADAREDRARASTDRHLRPHLAVNSATRYASMACMRAVTVAERSGAAGRSRMPDESEPGLVRPARARHFAAAPALSWWWIAWPGSSCTCWAEFSSVTLTGLR